MIDPQQNGGTYVSSSRGGTPPLLLFLGAVVAAGFIVSVLWVLNELRTAFVISYWFRVSVIVIVSSLILLVFAYLIAILVIHVDRYRNDRRRQRDGSFGMMKLKLNRGREAYVSMDHVYGTGLVVDRRNGLVQEIAPTADPQLYAALRMEVERKRRVQALAPGDDAVAKFARGGRQPELNHQALRYVDPPGKPARVEIMPGPDSIALPVVNENAVTLSELIRRRSYHQRPNVVVLGQGEDGVAEWDMETDPHLAVYGKTKTGKTRFIGMNVAVQQARNGKRVVVLDPDGGTNWHEVGPWVTVVPFDPSPALVMRWVGILTATYEERDAFLVAERVSTIYHARGRRPRPFVLHLEELSDVRSQLGQTAEGRPALVAFDNLLNRLARKGAARGMHLVTYAQIPESLPKPLSSNLLALTFRQGVNAGNDVGYWHAHELGVGEFAMGGQKWNAFGFSRDVALELLEGVRPLGPFNVPQVAVVADAPKAVSHAPAGSSLQAATVYSSAATVVSAVPSPSDTRDSPNVAPEASIALTKKDAVRNWRRANPDGTQADFRKWATENNVAMSRSTVNDVFHESD